MMGNSLFLKTDELIDVENYLKGGTIKDPFFSHTIAVKILEHGRFTYPSLFTLALKYRKTEDYKTLSRLIEYFAEQGGVSPNPRGLESKQRLLWLLIHYSSMETRIIDFLGTSLSLNSESQVMLYRRYVDL